MHYKIYKQLNLLNKVAYTEHRDNMKMYTYNSLLTARRKLKVAKCLTWEYRIFVNLHFHLSIIQTQVTFLCVFCRSILMYNITNLILNPYLKIRKWVWTGRQTNHHDSAKDSNKIASLLKFVSVKIEKLMFCFMSPNFKHNLNNSQCALFFFF